MSFYVEDPRAGCNTSHQSGVQGQNLLPHSAYHDAFAAAQDVFGFLGCKCPVLAQVQHLIHKQPEVLLCWASLNPFISHPVSEPGCPLVMCRTLLILIVFTQTCFYKLVQTSLDDNLSLRFVSHTAQLGAVCRLPEGALNPNFCVIDEDIKEYWTYLHHVNGHNIFAISVQFKAEQIKSI